MTFWLLVLSYRRLVGAKAIQLVACVGSNGLRKERDAREKHAREEGAPALSGETPMKFVSRPLCSLRNRRLDQLLPSACCRLQNVAAQHGGFVGSSTERRSRKNARERLAVPLPLLAFARPTKTATLRQVQVTLTENKHLSHMFTRLKIHHHFSMFTNIVPNYGETCTRQKFESLYDKFRNHFETFFAKTSVDNYVLFLSNFFQVFLSVSRLTVG